VGASAEHLGAGSAFADVSSWRIVGVAGSDARRWLNDLVSAELSAVVPGRTVPALLLAPTGGIRAAFVVAEHDGELLLIQDPDQPAGAAELLAPYVLSSDVTLADRGGSLLILAFPGLDRVPEVPDTSGWTPSILGPGADLVAPAGERERIVADLGAGFAEAAAPELEAWRVRAGIPRVGLDTIDGDLPQEAGLDHAVAFDKGCFVGQEAVAKMRTRGHPRRLVLPVTAEAAVAAGDVVLAEGDETGSISSVALEGDRTYALARVRWADRDRPLRTASGVTLRRDLTGIGTPGISRGSRASGPGR
jgi:folate-binding protein YgfZ